MKELKLLGREAEMLKERPLELPGVADVEKKWDTLRDKSKAFEGQRDRWKFCASEVLYSDSLFFLGLNPSEPTGHDHTCFGLEKLIEYDGIFNPLRKMAAQLEWTYSYFDLFCFRRTEAVDLQDFLSKLLETEEGRDAVAALIELAGQAIKTASPKAIYVCNGTAKDILQGKKALAKLLRKAGLSSAFFFASPKPIERPFPLKKIPGKTRKMHFFYTVTRMSGRPIPVVLGMDIANTHGLTKNDKEEMIAFVAQTFEKALRDPEDYYRQLPEGR